MMVKVVPLPCSHDGIKFDIILPEGYAKTIELDIYALRAYRGASVTEIIEQIVLDFVQESCQIDNVAIIYC
jgi:hypothetical protein